MVNIVTLVREKFFACIFDPLALLGNKALKNFRVDRSQIIIQMTGFKKPLPHSSLLIPSVLPLVYPMYLDSNLCLVQKTGTRLVFDTV